MSEKLAPLRGMKDLLPDEFRIHRYIENISIATAKLYGYEGFSTPLLESAAVFDRSLGESSDILSKELYSFHDKKERLIALRPEFTASVMRAVISNGLKQKLPLKLFSSGPLFRYDRPQEGRQRQFHQVNFENLGERDPYFDAEIISLAAHILDNLGVASQVILELNSLGDSESRQNYQAALVEYFSKYSAELSEDSKKRLKQNPLRILDSKDETDKKIAATAPYITDYYTKSAESYFEGVKLQLDNFNLTYKINKNLVRGLDYYCDTIFEFTTSKSSVLAGGRYDGLALIMGEKEMPAIGFALGIERIMLLKDFSRPKERVARILPIDEEGSNRAIELCRLLRTEKIAAKIDFKGKISKRMQSAIADNARHIVFIGSDEVKNNHFKVKDLEHSIENNYNLADLIKALKE